MQKIAKALSLFRDKIEAVSKDANNPFFKSKYADLSSILDAIKSPLKEAGLALTHYPINTEHGFILRSVLMEIESWEKIEWEFPIFWSKPQEVWISITYARRYNTVALLDIPTEDDDWNSSNESERTKAKSVEFPTGEKKQYARTEADDILDSMEIEDDIEHLKTLFAKLYTLGKSDAQKAFYKKRYEESKKRIEKNDVFGATTYFDTLKDS